MHSPSLIIIGKVGALQSDLPMAALRKHRRSPYFPPVRPPAITYHPKRLRMLNSPKLTLVQELIAGASREELIWLSGYLAGMVAQRTHGTRRPHLPGRRAALS